MFINFICLPWRKGINLQKTCPNMKSRSRAPTSVKGIQNTPSRRSEKARFSRNKLVTVLILESWNSVRITRTLPVMPSRKIVLQQQNYNSKTSTIMCMYVSVINTSFEWNQFRFIEIFNQILRLRTQHNLNISMYFKRDADMIKRCNTCL